MGKAAENEKLKLRATFYNNIAVSLVVTGYLVPCFAFAAWITDAVGKLPTKPTSVWELYAALYGPDEAKIKIITVLTGGAIAIFAAFALHRFAQRILNQITD